MSSLHLDGIPLLERVVQDARCVDDLPPQVLVIGVPHEERLGGEGVGLHLDVCASYLVDETRLANVGEASYQDGPRVRVDGWKATEVLADLQFGVQLTILYVLLSDSAGIHNAACALYILGFLQKNVYLFKIG